MACQEIHLLRAVRSMRNHLVENQSNTRKGFRTVLPSLPNPTSVLRRRRGTAILLFLLFPFSVVAQQTENSQKNANALARSVLMNEAKVEAQDHSHWMLRVESEKAGRSEVDQVVETKDGDLKLPILIDGRRLTVAQEKAANQRIQKLVADPDILRKSMRDESEDSARSQRMLKVLPKALSYSFGEQQGDTVELHFKPNPEFRPDTREERVFQAMDGDIWVNRKQERLMKITGHLSHEVKFGWGVLGHLDSGGRFEVQQTEVTPGYWELTLLNVDMRGKALFFKTINVQQKLRRSDFQRISDDMTLSQAANLLRNGAAAGQLGSKTNPMEPVKAMLDLKVRGQSRLGVQ